MKALIVFDSQYGNTQKIAEEIGKALQEKYEVLLRNVHKVQKQDVEDAGVLVLGTPVHGGRPTPAMQTYVGGLQKSELRKAKVLVFDTRFDEKSHGLGLKILMRTIGYAAPKMAKVLGVKGVRVDKVEGFIVEGKEGPLKNGELDRARLWVEGT